MKYLTLFITLIMFIPACQSQIPPMKKITKGDMTVAWKIENEHLYITMNAPTKGWVAIGLNTMEQLQGTNLIMAAIKEGMINLSDRYILAPGDHKSISDLGGTNATVLISGVENDAGTQVEFMLPLKASDKFHVELQPGRHYFLLLAYSQEDDFSHHSMMRTTVEIEL